MNLSFNNSYTFLFLFNHFHLFSHSYSYWIFFIYSIIHIFHHSYTLLFLFYHFYTYNYSYFSIILIHSYSYSIIFIYTIILIFSIILIHSYSFFLSIPWFLFLKNLIYSNHWMRNWINQNGKLFFPFYGTGNIFFEVWSMIGTFNQMPHLFSWRKFKVCWLKYLSFFSCLWNHFLNTSHCLSKFLSNSTFLREKDTDRQTKTEKERIFIYAIT